MKIDPFTISVLENFASINQSLFIKEGNVLETMSVSKTIKAVAQTETKFPINCGFYNLWKFISVLHLYDDPDVLFGEQSVIVSSGSSSTQIFYSEDGLVDKVSEKHVVFPDPLVKTFLSSTVLKDINKARKLFRFEDIFLVGDGTELFIETADASGASYDRHVIKLGQTDQIFQAIFKANNLALLPDDYEVELTNRVSKFTSSRLTYYIALEEKSQF